MEKYDVQQEHEIETLLQNIQNSNEKKQLVFLAKEIPTNEVDASTLQIRWANVLDKINTYKEPMVWYKISFLVVANIPDVLKDTEGKWKSYEDPVLIDNLDFINRWGCGYEKGDESRQTVYLCLTVNKESEIDDETQEVLSNVSSQTDKYDEDVFFIPLSQIMQINFCK